MRFLIIRLGTILILFIFNPSLYAGGFEDYRQTILAKCPTINQLVIKKSLIELTQSQDCSALFTASLLKDCPQINCTSLINYWYTSNNSKSGAVIGN
jgi:hypothetical protein